MTRRAAVVGLGTISRYYLRALRELPDWELGAVCDVRLDALTPHLGTTQCFQDHRTLFREADVDAVVVTVPNDAHAAVCRDAVHEGLPVCVEKPLALTLDEGREVADLAAAEGVPVFTAFHRRYNDNVQRLRAALDGRQDVESVAVRYLELIEDHIDGDTWYLDPDRCGGGCVADNGPNAFDLVRLFLGDVEVVAATVQRDQSDVDKRARVRLRSCTGVRADVELDWSYPGEVKDVQVRMSDGTTHHADMLAGHDGFKASLWHEYPGVLDDFAAAIDASTGATGRPDGLAALELVDDTYWTERAGAAAPGKEAP